jgi:hypothetical protein
MFPTNQNEVIQEQEKFVENQLSQRVRKVPKGKRQLFQGVINFPMEGPKFPREKGNFSKKQ